MPDIFESRSRLVTHIYGVLKEMPYVSADWSDREILTALGEACLRAAEKADGPTPAPRPEAPRLPKFLRVPGFFRG